MSTAESFPLTVLLVEDNATHEHIIRRHLQKASNGDMVLEHVETLADALVVLKQGDIDAILLDLSLPDSEMNNTLPEVIAKQGAAPIIVLTSLDDLEFSTRAVGQGAQDFLVKSDLSGPLLVRSIKYAIERQRSQERLETMAAELESSNERLKGFAHTVAHEVKSPLTVVSGCLQMLEQGYRHQFQNEDWEYVEDANRALRGLTGMVDDLLEFARVGSDQKTFEEVDLEAVFYHAYVCLRSAIREVDAVVTRDPLPTVYGNEIQLRQLLVNLIGNALKYRSQHSPEIHIWSEESGTEWTFHVRDNGKGVPEDQHQHIFEAFVRIDEDESTPGSGIGLAFCERIVHNHNGKIWVTANKPQGTIFSFTIPRPKE